MKNVLYLIAVILTVAWLLGLSAYDSSSLIHILLALALIAVVAGWFVKDR